MRPAEDAAPSRLLEFNGKKKRDPTLSVNRRRAGL
jgi:hypothetical protein